MKKIEYDKIRTYFVLNKGAFLLASISGILYNVLMVLVPYAQGSLIDCFQEGESKEQIILYAILFLLLVGFIQVNRYLKRYFVRDFSNKMVLQMRQVSFNNLLLCNVEDLSSNSKGDIMTKNLSDIKDSAEGVRKTLTEVYDTFILMIGYFISMMILDYKTTLIVTLFILLSIGLSSLLKKKVYKATSSYKTAFANSKDATINCLKNELYYRGMGVSNNYEQDYEVKMNELEKKSIQAMVLKGSLEPFYKAIALIGLFFVIYYSSKKVMDGIWLIGTLSAYLTTYMLVARKASKVGKLMNAITSFKVSWKRCLPYLKTRDEKQKLEVGQNEKLMVKDLCFGLNENFVLRHINFEINKGKCLGICGVVRSGKSTLGAALSGLYPYEGNIQLYDVELKEVRNKILDNFIAYAPSQCEIFNDTVAYNIGFGKENVNESLRDACLEKEIKELRNQEHELISHSAVNLSGGQQKRLQIARCLESNAKLIILDDPFNAIDLEMTSQIMDNIKNKYKDSILILINNKKEMMEKMDNILFLNKKEATFGTFDSLMSNPEFVKLMGGEENESK